MAVNLDKPHRWKADIAESVRAYNKWFLASAPKAFREQRKLATVQVNEAMMRTDNLKRIDASTLEAHPGILPSLRMATCPPLARDRLVGLAGVTKGLVLKMEKEATPPPADDACGAIRRLGADQRRHRRARGSRHLSVDGRRSVTGWR